MESLMNPSYVQTNVRGEVTGREKEIAEVRGHSVRYDQFDSSDEKVSLYGNAAVVTGYTRIKATTKKTGRMVDSAFRFTDTFVRQPGGNWQVVASETTAVSSNP